jgi:hypothetical protein
MKEIESVYRIIHDETYNNQVLLDIELSKISDEKLVVGMLCDLYSKEGYKANKQAMILSMRNYCDIDEINLNLQECNAYFIDKMKEYRSTVKKTPSVDKLGQFLSILSSIKETIDVDGNVCLPDNKEYVDFVKELTNDEFDFFKNILLNQELYEEINNMINIRSNESHLY